MEALRLESVVAGDSGDRAVLRIAGELDAYTAPRLRLRIGDLVDDGTVHLIADMRGVDFMDSTGLGVLVGGLKRLRAHEGTLALVITSERILRIFQVTGLTKQFPIHSTVAAAIAEDAQWSKVIADPDGWCQEHGLA